ncbi:MAG: septum site-determining protein MinC [Methylibium sp.]|uniref:septum site-determining protein MinC n=1 Tax=unclassified Methylibium TaxID=2633235 RepID=UPI0006F65A69|nr:septum site-determining protein MinC [Methylibium sp. Root1272]KQW75211.1 septum site-determining protein MinC [Methylibium sp. Root1272]MDP1791507.1 septum site-determining protein MinC [Methylibium sp.]
MTVDQRTGSSASFELKSAALMLVAVILKTTDRAALARELDERIADTPGLFERDPVVIDLSQVREADAAIDFPALIELLRERQMLPLAVRGGNEAQMADALSAGLVEAPAGANPAPPARAPSPVPAAPPVTLTEIIREVPVAGPGTMIVDRPLRSGQQVYAKGCDLVVLAAVNVGAEVIADGNIHVYGPLRGRAIAGARGNADARIFATCMEPQLISIAGTYRTTETPLPAEVLGKPAQVKLQGDKLLLEALKA